MLDVLNGDGGSLDPSSNVLDASSDGVGSTLDASSNMPPNYLPSPEATSPALDATFYYVLCTMILLAAVFGNFLLVSDYSGTLSYQKRQIHYKKNIIR